MWLGTCIAKNNYPFFLSFVVCLNVLLFFVISVCIAQLVLQVKLHRGDSDVDTDASDALGYMRTFTWILLVFTVMMAIFTGFLLAFHCRLISKNETTNEYLKGRSKDRNYSFVD